MPRVAGSALDGSAHSHGVMHEMPGSTFLAKKPEEIQKKVLTVDSVMGLMNDFPT